MSGADPSLDRDPRTGAHVGRTAVRVRYAETDRMGQVYNAHYLTWFEIGRTEFMRSAGFPYREIEERGILLPLVEASLRLRAPVRYDDRVVIETRLTAIRSRAVTFLYRILMDGKLLAEGSTVHACARAADGRSVVLPPWLEAAVRTVAS
jgi:acyl-CoA thioester hydrolase